MPVTLGGEHAIVVAVAMPVMWGEMELAAVVAVGSSIKPFGLLRSTPQRLHYRWHPVLLLESYTLAVGLLESSSSS